jgi:DNA-binding SARP family transcriptional activator
MSDLRISLLGEVQVTGSNWSSEVKLSPIIQALLAYLLLYRQRTHPREVLTELFWRDHNPEQARRCLNTALWRLRRHLETENDQQGAYLITTPVGNVGFNCECDYWLDVAVFEQPMSRISKRSSSVIDAEDAQELEHALQFYKGDLLEGFYDDWILRERERLRLLHLSYLAQLMYHYRHQNDYDKSLTYGQQILNYDPLREEIHREMMRLYLESGQRSLAVRQYKLCAQALSEELSILPMEETQRLYAQLTQANEHHLSPDVVDEPAALLQLLPQLRLTLQKVDTAREQLYQIIARAEQLTRRHN